MKEGARVLFFFSRTSKYTIELLPERKEKSYPLDPLSTSSFLRIHFFAWKMCLFMIRCKYTFRIRSHVFLLLFNAQLMSKFQNYSLHCIILWKSYSNTMTKGFKSFKNIFINLNLIHSNEFEITCVHCPIIISNLILLPIGH